MLDLKKLKALELPKQEVEVEILGEKQTVEVQSLDDETAILVASLAVDKTIGDGEREIRIRKEVLKSGVIGITDDDVDLLLKRGAIPANTLITSIRDLTVKYADVRKQAKEEIKKKSVPASSDSVKV